MSMAAIAQTEDFQWTIGNDYSLVQIAKLDKGGNSEVHKVCFNSCLADLTSEDAKQDDTRGI